MKTSSVMYLSLSVGLITALLSTSSCNTSRKKQETQAQDSLSMNMEQGPGAQQPNGTPPGPPPNGEQPNGTPPGPPPNGEKPNGTPPGPPPNGQQGQGGPGGGMQDKFDTSLIKYSYSLDTGSASKSKATIAAQGENQSGVVTFGHASLQLSGNKIITKGNTSSNDQSSFQGLNAAVLGRDESTIRMDHNTITTTGTGSNAIFAYGKSTIYTDNDVIDCTAQGAHGIMASGGGTIVAKNVNMITRGANSGVVATDRGSGTITVNGGTVKATGPDSPGIYSTGKITVSNVRVTATGAEVAVIEGSNSIVLNNCQLECSYQNKWGVMIYQSFSGDAEGVDGHFEVNGGSLNCLDKTGPLFFVTNSNANIFLTNTKLSAASGILLNASASRWGHEGSNGGKAHLTASKQKLTGALTADKNSRLEVKLTNGSQLNGQINTANTAQHVSVEVDASSNWSLSGDSYVDSITAVLSGKQVSNISGNGHTLWYSKTANPALGGKTYQLQNGGSLKAR